MVSAASSNGWYFGLSALTLPTAVVSPAPALLLRSARAPLRPSWRAQRLVWSYSIVAGGSGEIVCRVFTRKARALGSFVQFDELGQALFF